MMIHAYDEDYVAGAQDILGNAIDFAVNTLDLAAARFMNMFTTTNVAAQFEMGNPRVVAGMTGCELVREVLYKSGLPDPAEEDAMYLDKSPEYWTGWALAYYQWWTGATFELILKQVNIDEMIAMYMPYHEMDIRQFVDALDQMIRDRSTFTRLRQYRDNLGFSQAQLAQESDVSLRQIQLFEQRQRDINKAEAGTLLKLSRALKCRMEDLMEVW